jgi:hypothetical protein
MSPAPAHHSGQRRWIVLGLVLAVLVGVGVAAHAGAPPRGQPPPEPVAEVGTATTESSSWYCTAQTTTSGALGVGAVVLTNRTDRAVNGSIHTASDTGVRVTSAVRVPARGELVVGQPPAATGLWVSQVVDLAGGGVAVSHVVHGADGWAEGPCLSSTARQWYFPSGATAGNDGLFVALYNPTATADVVDVSFTTPKGVEHPINFQGLVLQPDQTKVESVAPYIQNEPSVATTVSTRSGRVVAGELQTITGGGSGLALMTGSPQTERRWIVPVAAEPATGTGLLDVFNPGPLTVRARVHLTLASGPVSPIAHQVAPGTTWTLVTSSQIRIPKDDPYSAVIDATGGVVVGRAVAAPTAIQAPQVGLATAVDARSATVASRQWLVPPPGAPGVQIVPGARPAHLVLVNLSTTRTRYQVAVLLAAGPKQLAAGVLGSSATLAIGPGILRRAGLHALVVRTGAPTGVSEDVGPTGGYGVVTMPGIPLASAGS